jgi:hypothetical protein
VNYGAEMLVSEPDPRPHLSDQGFAAETLAKSARSDGEELITGTTPSRRPARS